MTTDNQETRALDEDTTLMVRVSEGDQQAFELLVERYRQRVIGVLFHLVGNADDADELAQEVFLRVFRSRRGYKPTAKFSTWLFTIVNNLALNAIRNRKRKATNIASTESGPLGARPMELLAVSPSGASPSRVFAREEMAEIVRQAVAQLSEDQRMAVMLHRFEGMSYKQIGDVLEKSEMAVKSLLSRARTSLREILEPYLTIEAVSSR